MGASAVLAGALVSCGGPADDASTGDAGSVGGKADEVFAESPLYLTGAFDGSQRFGMWIDTMQFTRDFEREHGKPLHWTYFINTCYYDETVTGSWIGKAESRDEELVRGALTQQALNEGHEIANHAVLHQDGSEWSVARWTEEFTNFHEQTDNNLFIPIPDADGGHVFPNWQADGDPGSKGAQCQSNSDCDSNICLPLTPDLSVCSERCNKNLPCGDGFACGAPTWNTSTDVCVPLPEFPVEYRGEVLFDDEGNPNPDAEALSTYRIVGFRAPQLGHNGALFEVMEAFGYAYDTSKILPPGFPQKTQHGSSTFEELYQFALMKHPGSRTVPMDYNYKANDVSGERMLQDYKNSIVRAYENGRQPWNIGHHFALWKGGAYWRAMKDAFTFAAQGCPADDGTLQCEEVEFPTFRDLVGIVDAKTDAIGEDIFIVDEDASLPNDAAECPCGDDEEEGAH